MCGSCRKWKHFPIDKNVIGSAINGRSTRRRPHRAARRRKPNCVGEPIPLPLLCPGVKSTTLFENDGRYVRLHHRQTSGNPVRIGDGCATVTNFKLPRPLVSSRDREGGSEA